MAAGLAGLVGLFTGLLVGGFTTRLSGSWCPKCGDPKRCPRGHTVATTNGRRP